MHHPRNSFKPLSTRDAAALAFVLFSVSGTALGQTGVWPVYDVLANGTRGAVNRGVLQGFGDGSIQSMFVSGIHEGLDIRAGGQGGEEVAATRTGILLARDPDEAGGAVYIRVNVGTANDPRYETDAYSHVVISSTVAVGSEIARGDKIGTISSTYFTEVDGTRSAHLHYSVFSGTRTTRGGLVGPEGNRIDTIQVNPAGLLNPLARMAARADRDPRDVRPTLADTNHDDRSLIVARSNTTTPLPGKTINGGVDLIADIRDDMNAGFLGASGPKSAGYYVTALFDRGVAKHDVHTAASPYMLVDFNDTFFYNDSANIPAGLSRRIYADDAELRVTTDSTIAGYNNSIFPMTRNFILTNTDENTGRLAAIDGRQFWNTRAEDNPDRTDTHHLANMSDSEPAEKNADARFKDGDYEIHVMAGDLVDTVDLNAGKVRVNNFVQAANPKKLGAAPLPNPGPLAALYDNNTPFAPGYEPSDPEFAATALTFDLGEFVGVSGDEFYPNLLMPVFITPHRSYWLDGDSFNGILAGYVLSDSLGLVPDTMTFYQAYQMGEFDMVIDYDRDGRFSATLDGLTGFNVIPTPGTGLLVAAGVVFATRRRRHRAG